MKRIYVSQRVDSVLEYNERRDALDQRWASFLEETAGIPFPMPNNPRTVLSILKTDLPDGLLLTGGSNPVKYGGTAPERDDTDNLLIDHATRFCIPLIGVCRGMQSILLYFGGSLRETENHIATRHMVSGRINRIVNSYHSLTADVIPSCFEVIARSDDGVVEAMVHSSLSIMAIMWHPEREHVFASEDVELFHNMWQGKGGMV